MDGEVGGKMAFGFALVDLFKWSPSLIFILLSCLAVKVRARNSVTVT